ncbi:MOS4-associated complex 3A [Hibiscus syriacus]|uniref:MOS4-associated complex 3A n=1 Tax=Hibiscus syriacus TaxID=106335 RepID=A0A6A3CZG4_HIBSY|nr:MOS4-associated complex 3A [Hibiscus syriacus]
MLQDMIHPQEQQLPSDDVSSPNSGPVFYFSDTDLFSDIGLQSFEVMPANFCFDESTNYMDKASEAPTTTTNTAVTTVTTDNDINIKNNDNSNNNNFSIIFDSCPSTGFLNTVAINIPFYGTLAYGTVATITGVFFDDDCLSSMPSYVPLNPSSPSCSFLGGPSMAAFMPMTNALPADNSGIFCSGNIITGPHELLPQDLEFQSDNAGIFCPDSMQLMFKPGDLQGLSCDNQQVVGARMSSTPLATEMSSLEDSTFNKVGKLSAEQRKEKIHRYMKKRNERNFTKKIKYACRKTLADSRPRVRGRFAKMMILVKPKGKLLAIMRKMMMMIK